MFNCSPEADLLKATDFLINVKALDGNFEELAELLFDHFQRFKALDLKIWVGPEKTFYAKEAEKFEIVTQSRHSLLNHVFRDEETTLSNLIEKHYEDYDAIISTEELEDCFQYIYEHKLK